VQDLPPYPWNYVQRRGSVALVQYVKWPATALIQGVHKGRPGSGHSRVPFDARQTPLRDEDSTLVEQGSVSDMRREPTRLSRVKVD
jgi:hypothetical protein